MATSNEDYLPPRWGAPEQEAITAAVNKCLDEYGQCVGDEGKALGEALETLRDLVAVKPEVTEPGKPTRQQLIEAARTLHGNDEVNIDNDACLSESDEGSTWVQAWVWVHHSKILGGPDWCAHCDRVCPAADDHDDDCLEPEAQSK